MKKRVISAIVFGLIFFPAVILGRMNMFGLIYYLLFSCFCGYVGTFEIMNMFYKKEETLKIMRFIVPAFSVILIVFMHLFIAGVYNVNLYINPIQFLYERIYDAIVLDNWMIPFILIFYILILIISFLLFSVFKKGASAFDAIACIFAFLYGGLLLGLAFSIEYLHINGHTGWYVFAYVYAIVCFTDIFAYVIGSKFGKHKLCPTISPHKSVEGAIGGTVIGSVIGTLILIIYAFDYMRSVSIGYEAWRWILLFVAYFLFSIVLSVVSQLGDLIASKLKRTYDIKDFGNIMPGHGGVIDRFDSFILAGSFVFILYALINAIMVLV